MSALVGRLRGAVTAVSRGGVGTAVVSLAPRVSSVAAQWLLSLAAGHAAGALFVTCISNGSAVAALVGPGMTPVIVARRRLFTTRRGRALVAGAVGWIAVAALLIALIVGAVREPVGWLGLAAALYACSTVFYNCAPAAWAFWQSSGRFARVLGVSLLVTPVLSSAAALAGAPWPVVALVGLGGALPMGAMLGRVRVGRSLRLALWLVRHAVPLALPSMATAIVYPEALRRGIALYGATSVGKQTLYWSLVLMANVALQSFTAREVVAATGNEARALRRWLAATGVLVVLLAVALSVFRWMYGAEVVPRFLLVGAAVFLVTDGLVFYFAPAVTRPALVVVSWAAAFLVVLGMIVWPAVLWKITVIGPSVIVAILRLPPLLAFPAVRAVAAGALAVLLGGAALALGWP
ncbi:hypothetical protein [Chondromyces apiculatus]|uniref:Membrane protein involved in the export of O-antigen and teichoic acid n=1 Tax=Chondromyces apiculatus DSM 436 TaxID=1192034 RepID=A0A017T721_9BACT|nr:hypothetical protein [Chondromyces apiculatus]EYF04822.1 Hypothetical protein CAP_3848 [Chondromyces apiculatus DSM 436]